MAAMRVARAVTARDRIVAGITEETQGRCHA